MTVPPLVDHKKQHKDDRIESWHTRGYDYDKNFTMNFCAPVIEPLEDVVGISDDLVKNVSAFYVLDKKTYSIGYVHEEGLGRHHVSNYAMSRVLIDAHTAKHPQNPYSEVASSS